MATTPWEHAASVDKAPSSAEKQSVIEKLLGNPKSFSFVQAVRLLALCGRDDYQNNDDEQADNAFLHRGLKVVPELSLGHPTTDIVDIRQTLLQTADDEPPLPPRYTMVATFLSLYGTSSPLPTFYTEELLDEARRDESASRDFLDIFNQTLYRLYYRAYNNYKLGFRTREQHDAALRQVQFCLLGIGGETLRRAAKSTDEDLQFIGQFSRHARSAHGLRQYLTQRVEYSDIHIEQCVERNVPIPKDQFCRLGRAALNGESAIGTQIRDSSGTFRIHLRNLDAAAADRFAPGGEGRTTLEHSVRKYLNVPLGYDLVRHVAPDTLPGTRLGQQRLGVNAVVTVPAKNPAKIYVSYRAHTAA